MGPSQRKYLVANDLDNKKAKDEFCNDCGIQILDTTYSIKQASNPDMYILN